MSYLKDYSPFCVLELKSWWNTSKLLSNQNLHDTLTLTDQAPIRTLIEGGGVYLLSILAPVTDRDKKISGGSFAFLGKITFSSPSGQTSP